MEDHKTVFRRLKEQVEKSAYQKDLHFSDENESENLIRTHFLNIKRKETWSYRTNLKLDCMGDISNPDFISYKVRNIPFHGLIYTTLIQQLPSITAEHGFEIRWCPNIGSNIVKECSFKVNDVEWQHLNSEYFDDYHQKISIDTELDMDLGNVPSLQEWNSVLPSYTTRFWMPWFYSLHSSKMFPLYFCGKEDNVLHEMHFRRYIGELLVIRRSDTKEIIPFDEACIRIGGNTPNNFQLPVPEMRGEYIFMSDMECEHNRCDETKSRLLNCVFDIDNVKAYESDNTHTMNTTVNLKIKDMPFPVHTIHWQSVNLDAKKMNYLSNYTTNPDNHLEGSNPIKWISLSTVNGILFKNQDFYIGEKLVSKRNFKKTPKHAGYGVWTNAVNASDPLYPKPGIKLDDSELTFRLENSEASNSSVYRINTQVVYTYRITIKDYPRNEAERNTKGIEFEISGDF